MNITKTVYRQRVLEILNLSWVLALDWDEDCEALVMDYYGRIFRWWPENRSRLPPNDKTIYTKVNSLVSIDDSQSVESTIYLLQTSLRIKKARVESATIDLVRVILLCALAVDNDVIHPDCDPGLPLTMLFQKGYQLAYTDAGIEVHYQKGWVTVPLPRRSAFEFL
ncbi:hypothetical protein [Dyadobacter sp. CY326]|uniref:hypothetical protein n=1 Tax=Dyadobacter sp. CY326 TaxID=2907300 RepID=UPI001F32A6DF|nr:hypothetical protein [Dyadobacter sp. CY326]